MLTVLLINFLIHIYHTIDYLVDEKFDIAKRMITKRDNEYNIHGALSSYTHSHRPWREVI